MTGYKWGLFLGIYGLKPAMIIKFDFKMPKK